MKNKRIVKILAAIEFIETHLTDKLDLETVAGAVHYSKYHLHRVFADTIGLTIHDYVQRRQLTEAAKLLVFSTRPIIEIAILAGYDTQQSFTNIFTAMYKQSPNQYRENEKFYPLQLKFCLKGDSEMLHTAEIIDWDVSFATEADISSWMDLVRLVIDGFPRLQEDEYILELKRCIKAEQALISKDGTVTVGIMIFSAETGSIEFMGIHPFYRKRECQRHF